jgi:ABC-type uncharacterized transport system involved in gliding motility auxiliary subunit
MNEDGKEARRSIWRRRTLRTAIGLNVVSSVLLAAAVLAMANYLAWKYLDLRRDISSRRYYALSDKTLSLLSSLRGEVRVIVLFQKSQELFEDVKRLLKEYEHAAAGLRSLNLRVEFVDPDRDPARTRELARVYDVSDVNVVIFEMEGRKKYVGAKDMVDYEISLEGKRPTKRMTGFRAEQAFSSALQSITQAATPVVCFLGGHGEHDAGDTNEKRGYSRLARVIRRDNVEVKTTLLAGRPGVPEDCAALVVAGPNRRLSSAELDMLSAYLNRNGRVLLLLDSGATTGLEDLLAAWGVKLAPDVVTGLTLTGRELVVTEYGQHPITRRLRNVATMFYQPRSVEPLETGASAAERTDKPKVSILAATTREGRARTASAESAAQPGGEADRAGPISVALAVEKGAHSGIEVGIRPTRMVVVGDSDFVCNGALSSGMGGNEDFFMSALNWLLEREALMAIAPKVPGELRLDMDQRRARLAFLAVVAGFPALAAVAGLLVWVRRRR